MHEYDTIRMGTLENAFWAGVSFPEVQSSEEVGRTGVQSAWPLCVRGFKCRA